MRRRLDISFRVRVLQTSWLFGLCYFDLHESYATCLSTVNDICQRDCELYYELEIVSREPQLMEGRACKRACHKIRDSGYVQKEDSRSATLIDKVMSGYQDLHSESNP